MNNIRDLLEVIGSINNLINQIPQYKENALLALGNLHNILSGHQLNIINSKIKEIITNDLNYGKVWNVILFFGKSDPYIIEHLKESVLIGTYLWPVEYSTKNEKSFINVQHLNRMLKKQTNYPFNSDEHLKLFEILKEKFRTFKTINENSIGLPPLYFDHLFILKDMVDFLEDVKWILNNNSDYISLKNEINLAYNKERGYQSIFQGLISKDKSIVVLALNELSLKIHDGNLTELHNEINCVLNKIILETEPGVDAALGYLATWISENSNSHHYRQYKFLLLEILIKYQSNDFFNYEKPYMHEKLFILAQTLKSWGIDDPAIKYWIDLKEESLYNNIIFL